MTNNSAQIVQKLWNYCHVLRDDGLSYGDYVEQLTYLLFLKMAHERTQPPWGQASAVPAGFDWPALMARDGDELEVHYRHLLEELGKKPGMIGVIFRKAQNKIQDPAKLRRLVADLIDREQWTILDADVKGDAYEGLLEKNAQDTKSGAGQYFTPRPLIQAIVDVMQPRPGETICDPACGTGGFLLAAHDYAARHYALDRDQKEHLRFQALHGWEIVDNAARLCAMNLLLHGIGGEECPIQVDDALRSHPGNHFEMVLTNPPFGKKSSITVVKANVLFFDRKPASETPWTRTLWIYDLRTNQNFTLKTNPLQRADLDEFVACCNPERRHERAATWSEATPEGRWRSYGYEELLQRDKVSLDIFWLRDESLEDSANLPDPDVLAAEIAEDLQAALDQFALIAQDLGAGRDRVPA